MQKNANANHRGIIYWIAAAVAGVAVYFIIGEVLRKAEEISPLTFESFAAILGAVITVLAMAVMIRFQASQDTQREYSSRVFERKLDLYLDLLDHIFAMDDDNVISKQEILAIENKVGTVCLVAAEPLVETFSQFTYQLKAYGVMYPRSMNDAQLDHFAETIVEAKKVQNAGESFLTPANFARSLNPAGNQREYFVALDDVIQGIREDLGVVEGNVQRSIEQFTTLPFDKFELMQRPNIVDLDPSIAP